MRDTRKLVAFVLGLVVVWGGFELWVRAHEPAFEAATHRVLAKEAILDKHGPLDVIFYGSSRSQDGVSPRLFVAELEALGSGQVTAFNLASTSLNMHWLKQATDHTLNRAGLKLAMIEVSTPQLLDDDPQRVEATPTDLEGRLSTWVHGHSSVISSRSALVSDNIVRMPSLLWFAADLDGSETRVLDQWLAFLGRRESLPVDFDEAMWAPVRWDGAETPTAEGIDTSHADELAGIAANFHLKGVSVLFMVPPLTKAYAMADERKPAFKAFFREVAHRSGSMVLDYSDVVLPGEYFRGESHLNRLGRGYFSCSLAREVARADLLSGWTAKGP